MSDDAQDSDSRIVPPKRAAESVSSCRLPPTVPSKIPHKCCLEKDSHLPGILRDLNLRTVEFLANMHLP